MAPPSTTTIFVQEISTHLAMGKKNPHSYRIHAERKVSVNEHQNCPLGDGNSPRGGNVVMK